jgi:DNA modification methylase
MFDRTLFPAPTYRVMDALLVQGDCRDLLSCIPTGSVHCVVTSPPYWGLRDFGLPPSVWGGDRHCSHQWGGRERGRRADLQPPEPTRSEDWLGTDDRQRRAAQDGGRFCGRCGAWCGSLGQEPTVELYVEHLVAILRDGRRVLRPDGTLWLNLGDSYFGDSPCRTRSQEAFSQDWDPEQTRSRGGQRRSAAKIGPLKPKDLCGIPWRVALALQDDGWWLRSDIVWAKPNPCPESVKDRPTRSHEYVFLLTQAPRYYYDRDAIREPHQSAGGKGTGAERRQGAVNRDGYKPPEKDGLARRAMVTRHRDYHPLGRNRRTVWTIPARPFQGAHFATFPPALVEPCIRAGTSAAGCCPRCAAPWERLVKRGEPLRAWQQACGGNTEGQYHGSRKKAYAAAGAQDASAVKARILAGMRQRQTVGWRPTCPCAAGAPVPCVVLDPFAGVATTGLVALELGRRFLGIELNPEYIALARERLSGLTVNKDPREPAGRSSVEARPAPGPASPRPRRRNDAS